MLAMVYKAEAYLVSGLRPSCRIEREHSIRVAICQLRTETDTRPEILYSLPNTR